MGAMHETAEDLAAMQAVLDTSYEQAGVHLKEVITPDRRLTAEQLAARLDGVCLLVLATVTADGRPICGPVDGIFYRGSFHFGSSPESVRFKHIRQRPWVSASHLPGEELAVSVHGRAVMIDVLSPDAAGFKDALLGIYVPRYGEQWGELLERGAAYARIEADRIFTFNGEGL